MANSNPLDPLLATQPSSGTQDDGDNPNDERDGENEPPIREVDDRTEAPEEFSVEDEFGQRLENATDRPDADLTDTADEG